MHRLGTPRRVHHVGAGIPIEVGHPRDRKIDRPIVAVASQLVDDGATRIAQTQQLGDLVVRLSGGIVAGPAKQVIPSRLGHLEQAGVAAGDDQHDRRQRERSVIEEQRLDMSGQVMYRHERDAQRQHHRLGERHADQERADEPRPLRDRDRADVRPADAGVPEGPIHDSADVTNVLAGRQLRHDAAPFAVDRDLRGDDARADVPGAFSVAGLGHDGCRRLVTGGFDAEDVHGEAVASRASRKPSV